MRRYVTLFILLFMVSFNVKAAVCNNNDKVRYQEMAKNITYSYEYNDANNTFNLIFTNISEELYLENLETEERYNYQGPELRIVNLIPGNSYKYNVSTGNVDCLNEDLYTVYVTLPYYNSFYNNELCNGIENYKYCKKFINKSVTYEEFVKNVTDYKNSLANNLEENPENNVSSIFKTMFNWFLKYYYIILPIVIVTLLLIIWIYNKKHDLF